MSILAASGTGTGPNGFVIGTTVTGAFTVGNVTAFSGGLTGTFTPGEAVKTLKEKMYAISDALLHGSAINDPSEYTIGATGAFFSDLSSAAAGAETLTGLVTERIIDATAGGGLVRAGIPIPGARPRRGHHRPLRRGLMLQNRLPLQGRHL